MNETVNMEDFEAFIGGVELETGRYKLAGGIVRNMDTKECRADIRFQYGAKEIEGSRRETKFRAKNTGEIICAALTFMASAARDLINDASIDPSLLEKIAEEIDDNDTDYTYNLEVKLLATMDGIKSILQKLQTIPASEDVHGRTLQAAIGALHVLASDASGRVSGLDESSTDAS